MSLKTIIRPFTEVDPELDDYLVRRSGLFNDTRLEKQVNQLIKNNKATKELIRDAFVMAPLIIVKKKAAEDIIENTTAEERWNALRSIKYSDIITLVRKKWKMNSKKKQDLVEIVKDITHKEKVDDEVATAATEEEEADESTAEVESSRATVKTDTSSEASSVASDKSSEASEKSSEASSVASDKSSEVSSVASDKSSEASDKSTEAKSKTSVVVRKKTKKFEDIVFKIVDGAAVAESGDIDGITVDGPKLLVIDFENCANDIYPITVRFESSKTGKAIFNYIIDAVKQLKEKSLCGSITSSNKFSIKNEVQSARYMCFTIHMN